MLIYEHLSFYREADNTVVLVCSRNTRPTRAERQVAAGNKRLQVKDTTSTYILVHVKCNLLISLLER